MNNNKLENFRGLKAKILSAGDENIVKELRQKSKLTARERINMLFDSGTFVELDAFVKSRPSSSSMENTGAYSEGVITGYGLVEGKLVYAYAQDYTVLAGSIGEMHGKKIVRVQEMALKMGAPIIGLQDSGGARIQEGINALAVYAEILRLNTISSGVIPQITAIMGLSAGSAAYTPALSDFVFMVNETSQLFVNGPNAIGAATSEKLSAQDIGGAIIHNESSGTAHFLATNDMECIDMIRELIVLIPSNNIEGAPIIETNDDINKIIPGLENLIPEIPDADYDMRNIIMAICDDGYFMEVHKYFAQNILTGFIRIYGQTIGVIGNQPNVLDGCLDINSSDKGARFVRFCDSFNIPVLTLVDVPGFLPEANQEYGGLIRHGGKLFYAYAEATVPKVTLVVRRAYGGGYIAMCSKNLGADIVFAWPTAEIAVMTPVAAANIVFKNEIANAMNPKEMRIEKVSEYIKEYATPYKAAEMGFVDDIIEPSATRPRVADALNMLMSKSDSRPSKKHGNIPL